DSAALERTVDVVEQVGKIVRQEPAVAHTLSVAGQSFAQNSISSNFAGMFVVLKPFPQRRGAPQGADAGTAPPPRRLGPQSRSVAAPPVQGLSNTGGFMLMVQDRGNLGTGELQAQADRLAARANRTGGLVGVFNSFRASTPQLYVDIDRVKAKSQGVPLNAVF